MTTQASQKKVVLRTLQPEDNAAVFQMVRTVMSEYGKCGPGYASHDPELVDMASTYQGVDRHYWVAVDEQDGKVIAGCGFSPLKESVPEAGICELQKLYCYSSYRGLGLGRQLLTKAMEGARQAGFRQMYLETVPEFADALKLYERFGFRSIPTHLGNTGHQHKCPIYMIRDLAEPVV